MYDLFFDEIQQKICSNACNHRDCKQISVAEDVVKREVMVKEEVGKDESGKLKKQLLK